MSNAEIVCLNACFLQDFEVEGVNVAKRIWKNQMFMSMNRILCQKHGIFCKTRNFVSKVDFLKKSTFFERGIFVKTRNFL